MDEAKQIEELLQSAIFETRGDIDHAVGCAGQKLSDVCQYCWWWEDFDGVVNKVLSVLVAQDERGDIGARVLVALLQDMQQAVGGLKGEHSALDNSGTAD